MLPSLHDLLFFITGCLPQNPNATKTIKCKATIVFPGKRSLISYEDVLLGIVNLVLQL